MATKKRGNGWPRWTGGDGGGGEIVIKGGSVALVFDGSLYLRDPTDPNSHKNGARKITRVRVEDENGQSLFDSNFDDGGLKWTITVSTE